MSKAQLSALLAKLKVDSRLRAHFHDAEELEEAAMLAQGARFDISIQDWQSYTAKQALDLSDEELEEVSGGVKYSAKPSDKIICSFKCVS